MNQFYLRVLWFSCAVLSGFVPGRASEEVDRDSIGLSPYWLQEAEQQILALQTDYRLRSNALAVRLRTLRQTLYNGPPPAKTGRLVIEYVDLQDSLRRLSAEAAFKLLRIRYLKGVELIRLLYEKILSMDHHLSSLKAQRQMLAISNPHEYGEFKAVRDILESRMKRKLGFTPPAFMQSNPYLSAVFTIVGLATGNEPRSSREQLERVGCILDFTVRIHGDLQIIYYETEYLRDANLTLKRECENLFSDCTRTIGYYIALPACREGDDWERLVTLLDGYIAKRLTALDNGLPSPEQQPSTHLQFAIDRIVGFLDKYTTFVGQGNEYYKKFSKIAGSYANEKICSTTLPDSFMSLKSDIEATLEKFNTAYMMPELQGSRLKELLYGAVE